jgi:uncharacterized protein YndB with AHSA1/START domain
VRFALHSSVANEERHLLFDETCELDAPPMAVFARLADHRTWPRWIAGLRRVDVDESCARVPGGAGIRRILYPIFGPPGVEVVTAFEPPFGLAYSATDDSLRGLCTLHEAVLSCTPTARGTRLRWTVRARPSSSWWKRIIARCVFSWPYRAGLRKLQEHFSVRAAK